MFRLFNLVKVEVLIDGEFSHHVTIPKRIIEDWNPSNNAFTISGEGDITDSIKKQSRKTINCIVKCYFGYSSVKDDEYSIDTSRYSAWFYSKEEK